MKNGCHEFHDRFLAGPVLQQRTEGHGAGCDPCAAWADRVGAHVRALTSLRRLELPQDLEGRVVAALFAGQRQDRAVDALARLRRAEPPAGLDRAVSGVAPKRVPAPDVLARLVAEELADPARAIAARHVGGLGRRSAPAELDACVHALLRGRAPAALRAKQAIPAARRAKQAIKQAIMGSRLRRVAALTAAASLLTIGLIAGRQWLRSPLPISGPEATGETGTVGLASPFSPGTFTFEVLRTRSAADLPAVARSIVPDLDVLATSSPSTEPLGAVSLHTKAPTSARRPVSTARRDRSAGAGSTPLIKARSLLELSMTASRTTAYSGRRRIEETSREVGGRPWVHVEDVHSDGQGRFAIVFDHLTTPSLSGLALQMFGLSLNRRQGLHYRYRDFALRDLTLFFKNFTVTDTGFTITVAGRTCVSFHIERSQNSDRRYLVAIDTQTGLILRALEEKLNGEQISLMEFQSLALSPDQGAIAWHQPANNEVVYPSLAQLSAQVSFSPLVPKALPPGYQLIEVATVTDAEARLWVKQTYSDGIDSLFFLHADPNQSQSSGTLSFTSQSSAGIDGGNKADTMVVLEAVPWTIATGDLGSEYVIAAGKVSTFEVLALLQSALP